ncbi:peptidylprolyl isomerase [Paracoccus pacificus]|uniref:Parvulin-like PPIase n=1 Tax=Paracoccus pacificus TaxID=1463598 RepID=A0ABW4R8F0_9RHOB
MRQLVFTTALACAGVLAGGAALTFGGLAVGVFPAPALAQSNQFQPVVYVNNSAVTRFELDQRLRFMQLLRAPDASAESAEKALIDDRLKAEAAKQAGVTVTDEQLQAGLEEFAGRANLSSDQFVQELERAGVARESYRDFVRSGVLWREVVRARFVGAVDVSDEEVAREMKKIVAAPKTERVLLSEIVLPVPPGQEQQMMDRAIGLASRLNSSVQFSQAARQFSASRSAASGGQLPWMDIGRLPPSLRPIITALRPGQVTQPLPVPNAIILFFLRDVQEGRRPGANSEVLDYLRITVGPAGSADAQTVASRVFNEATSCNGAYPMLNGLPGNQVVRDRAPQSAIPADIAATLAGLDDNEVSAPMNRGGNLELVMLCSRVPALVADEFPAEPPVPGSAAIPSPSATPPADPNAPAQAAAGGEGQTAEGQTAEGQPAEAVVEEDPLPQRRAVRDALLNRKIGRLADGYLAELRANAIIRRP